MISSLFIFRRLWLCGWSICAVFCGSYAWAHSEAVQVISQWSSNNQNTLISLNMVGQNSKLPILKAKIDILIYSTQVAQYIDPNKSMSDNISNFPSSSKIGQSKLKFDPSGYYIGQLPKLKDSDYAIATVDSTYTGENAVGFNIVSLRAGKTQFEVILPKTNTPQRYLMYAILGLLVPVVLVLGVWIAQQIENKNQPAQDVSNS